MSTSLPLVGLVGVDLIEVMQGHDEGNACKAIGQFGWWLGQDFRLYTYIGVYVHKVTNSLVGNFLHKISPLT